MFLEEARDLIHTVRSHMRQGNYIPARYILDFLIEATHARDRRSAMASVRLCQDWFDYNQEIFEIMEERRIRMTERRRLREAWRELRRIHERDTRELRERRERLEAETAEWEAARKEIAEERKRIEAAETEADLRKELLEERKTSEAEAARLQAEIAEMEGGGVNDDQRTLAESQATRDMIERGAKGSEHETGEAEGMASGSSDWEDVGMSEG